MASEDDNEVMAINEKLEAFIEEMSNTKSATLIECIKQLSGYFRFCSCAPVPYILVESGGRSHFPIGLFFYFRIWAFRVRLAKDMERIIKNNEQIQFIIQKINK